MNNGGADATANTEGASGSNEFGRLAQRTGNIGNGFPRFERDQFARAFAHRLDDQSNYASGRVRVRNRQRYPLRAFPPADDDKLARLSDLGNARRFDLQRGDVWTKDFFADDFMHEDEQ